MKNKPKITDLTNEELLRFFRIGGEMAYFAELYKRYLPKVYGLCLKYLGEQEMAKDAVMDVFQQLPEKIMQYEIDNFNSWLYSVVKNHCFQCIKKEKKNIFVNIDDGFVENDDFLTLTNKEQNEEEVNALEFCLETLNEEQKQSVKLFYFEEQSYADIVKITGYALSKVKSYIQNGKRNLKSCIMQKLQH